MINRRNLGVSLAALAASPVRALQMPCGGGWEDDPWWGRGAVAPVIQQIRAGYLRRLQPGYRNATRGQHEAHVRSIFPQVIEQNFARMESRTLQRYMRQASDRELSALAVLYSSDLNALSRTGLVLPVLTARCDDAAMSRLARAFGTMPMYEAMAHFAPQKLPSFERSLAGRTIAIPEQNQTFTPNIDMTILRIYQGFRSAPIGASSVSASLFQTAAYTGAYLTGAWYAGQWVGNNIVAPLIQNFMPTLWEEIGGTMNEIMNSLSGLLGIPISQAQQENSYAFGVESYSSVFEQTGGDYGSVEHWSIAAGYGGGGC